MKLETLTRDQVQQVREWRNSELQFLRTPYQLTESMQDNFFDNVINDRDSKHRYFAIVEGIEANEFIKDRWTGSIEKKKIKKPQFIGMCGLTNIEWENGTAEISLIINPEYRGKGYGSDAVDELLGHAFLDMRLFSVYGEVYNCGNVGFWEKIVEGYDGYKTNLVNRKYWNGEMYGSMWFSIERDDV